MRIATNVLSVLAWIGAAVTLDACAGSGSSYAPSSPQAFPNQPRAATTRSRPAVVEVTAGDRAAAYEFSNNRVHFTPPSFRRGPHRANAAPVGYPLDMTNYGGGTMPASDAYNVYVNCKDERCWGHPEEFLKGLAGTPFSNLITQYTGSPGSSYTYKGSLSVKYSHPYTNTYYSADLFAILAAAVRHFKADGLSVEYHIFLPEGVDTCFDQTPLCYSPDNLSAFQFCAYHGAAQYNHKPVVYSVEPYASPQVEVYGRFVWACQNQVLPKGVNREDSAQASALSHESFESWSDPLPNSGWFNANFNAEIGDICAYLYMQTIELSNRKWYIQQEYSNAAHGCSST